MKEKQTHNQSAIDPLLMRPPVDDGISGRIDGFKPVSEVLSHTDQQVEDLSRLTSSGLNKKTKHKISRRGLGAAATVTALSLASYGAGLITPDDGEAPYPGNMQVFENDPLIEEYRKDPSAFTIEGGALTPVLPKGPVPEVSELPDWAK